MGLLTCSLQIDSIMDTGASPAHGAFTFRLLRSTVVLPDESDICSVSAELCGRNPARFVYGQAIVFVKGQQSLDHRSVHVDRIVFGFLDRALRSAFSFDTTWAPSTVKSSTSLSLLLDFCVATSAGRIVLIFLETSIEFNLPHCSCEF